MTSQLTAALLLGAVVLLVAVGAVRVSTRLGLPSLLVYLALGVAVGEAGLGIRFNDVALTRVLGTCALILIIAEGGLTARWSTLRPVLAVSSVLATVGVVVSTIAFGTVLRFLLGFDWRPALLFGAVMSSTDAAAVFSTLRRVRIRPRLAAILEAESGINDAPAVILVLLLSAPGPVGPWWQQALLLVYELAAGALFGAAVGVIGAWLMRHAALPAAGLYPLAATGLTVLAYAVGAVAHASGFLAVYVAGVVLGNARLPHRQAINGFADGLAWLAQIGLFVLLGLLVSPSRLPGVILPALLAGVVLVLVARPVSVLLTTTWFRLRWRSQAFLSWGGLRGAVPIVLATIPLSEQVAGAPRLFDAVFVLVIVLTLVQGSTLPAAARLLRVNAPTEPTALNVESAPLERMRADLLQVDVAAGSRLAGVHVDELRLPPGAAVTLVLRDGRGFVPEPYTRLISGDSLLIVATTEARDLTERRLRAVSRRGRLARWLHDEGTDGSG
ncbi:MAG TPA: potassium/proton antiporter [Micromonosporaceae bacterium]